MAGHWDADGAEMVEAIRRMGHAPHGQGAGDPAQSIAPAANAKVLLRSNESVTMLVANVGAALLLLCSFGRG
jgi:hypothetical protein